MFSLLVRVFALWLGNAVISCKTEVLSKLTPHEEEKEGKEEGTKLKECEKEDE